MSIRVLIKLHAGYGLGDHVQMTAVLRHVRKNRPDWRIDFVGDPGKSDAMLGLAENVVWHGSVCQESSYDRVIDIDLHDTFCGWSDRPNTRVSACLHEKFGMEWERELGRYQVEITDKAKDMACAAMKHDAWVVVHPVGNSAQERKNLYPKQIDEISDIIKKTCCEEWFPNYLSAQLNCAFISRARAFVGIDSGPAKCAAATETPALVCWTGNHPALYFDPAPNVTHLIPANHEDNPFLWRGTAAGQRAALDFFYANYRWRTYRDAGDLPDAVGAWLREVLK